MKNPVFTMSDEEYQKMLTEILIQAVIHNDYVITTLLLEEGANPNALNDEKIPPLFFAIQHNAWRAAFALLMAGADFDYYCEALQTTPLMMNKPQLQKLVLSSFPDKMGIRH